MTRHTKVNNQTLIKQVRLQAQLGLKQCHLMRMTSVANFLQHSRKN